MRSLCANIAACVNIWTSFEELDAPKGVNVTAAALWKGASSGFGLAAPRLDLEPTFLVPFASAEGRIVYNSGIICTRQANLSAVNCLDCTLSKVPGWGGVNLQS